MARKKAGKFYIETSHNFMFPPQERFGFRIIYLSNGVCTLFESSQIYYDEAVALEAGVKWLLGLLAGANEAVEALNKL